MHRGNSDLGYDHEDGKGNWLQVSPLDIISETKP